MGILDELVILVKETIDEANQRNRQADSSSHQSQRSPDEIEALKRTLARRAMQQRTAEAAVSPHVIPLTQDEQRRSDYDRERKRLRQQNHDDGPAKVKHNPTHRAAKLLRQPATLREMIILKELLDKPISMRRGIRS
jgi:hypothetical protein